MIQAGLIARNAGIDAFGAPIAGLVDPCRVGQQRARHRHHVGVTAGHDPLGNVGHVDAVGGDQRNVHFTLELACDPRKCAAWDAGHDGRYPRFVPADAGIDDAGAGGFDRLGQSHDFAPVLPVLHQIEHRQAVDDDEVRAHRRTCAAHDLDGKTHAPSGIATPRVVTLVGVRGEKFVDQITLRAHHLDAVVANVLCHPRAVHEVVDGALDAAGGQGAGCKRGNW